LESQWTLCSVVGLCAIILTSFPIFILYSEHHLKHVPTNLPEHILYLGPLEALVFAVVFCKLPEDFKAFCCNSNLLINMLFYFVLSSIYYIQDWIDVRFLLHLVLFEIFLIFPFVFAISAVGPAGVLRIPIIGPALVCMCIGNRYTRLVEDFLARYYELAKERSRIQLRRPTSKSNDQHCIFGKRVVAMPAIENNIPFQVNVGPILPCTFRVAARGQLPKFLGEPH